MRIKKIHILVKFADAKFIEFLHSCKDICSSIEYYKDMHAVAVSASGVKLVECGIDYIEFENKLFTYAQKNGLTVINYKNKPNMTRTMSQWVKIK